MIPYNTYNLGTLDAAETLDPVQLQYPSSRLAIQAVSTGAPTTATLVIDGSLDGVNFFDVSGNLAASAGGLFFVVDKPVLYLRARISTLSGGTGPTVAVTALAVP